MDTKSSFVLTRFFFSQIIFDARFFLTKFLFFFTTEVFGHQNIFWSLFFWPQIFFWSIIILYSNFFWSQIFGPKKFVPNFYPTFNQKLLTTMFLGRTTFLTQNFYEPNYQDKTLLTQYLLFRPITFLTPSYCTVMVFIPNFSSTKIFFWCKILIQSSTNTKMNLRLELEYFVFPCFVIFSDISNAILRLQKTTKINDLGLLGVQTWLLNSRLTVSAWLPPSQSHFWLICNDLVELSSFRL